MGPFDGVASVFVVGRVARLLRLLRVRAALLQEHYLLRAAVSQAEGAGGRASGRLTQIARQLRVGEERVHDMCVRAGAAGGGGGARDAVAALVVFNSAYARDDCLRYHAAAGGAWWPWGRRRGGQQVRTGMNACAGLPSLS